MNYADSGGTKYKKYIYIKEFVMKNIFVTIQYPEFGMHKCLND